MEIFSLRVPELGAYHIGGSIPRDGNIYSISEIKWSNGKFSIYCEEWIIQEVFADKYEITLKEPFKRKARIAQII